MYFYRNCNTQYNISLHFVQSFTIYFTKKFYHNNLYMYGVLLTSEHGQILECGNFYFCLIAGFGRQRHFIFNFRHLFLCQFLFFFFWGGGGALSCLFRTSAT